MRFLNYMLILIFRYSKPVLRNDFLLADGPPQEKNSAREARYPAFPLLRDFLADNALIFVDDANRHSERKMIDRWLAEDAGWRSRWFDTVDGVCILSKST